MTRYIYSFIALICLFVSSALAQDHEGIGSSRANFVKSRYSAGGHGIEIYAEPGVNVAGLLSGLDLAKTASSQAIADRVNAKRKQLYPHDEIVLSIGPAEKAVSGEKAGLVRSIYWWNNTNCSSCYWYAQYTSTTATMFIDAIEYGSYDIYDKVGTNGAWIFRYNLDAGNAAGRYTVGSNQLRGFKGAAAGVASQADVVIFFFK